MIFETLSEKHSDLLLAFELENRIWFETFISSRDDQFYTDKGVTDHINESIVNDKSGRSYSGVLLKNGVIFARANLRGIDSENSICSVGYRVGKANLKRGLAVYCVSQLVSLALKRYGIKTLEAQVLNNNPASLAVLLKSGFERAHYQESFQELNSESLGCTTLRFRIA